MQFHATGGRGLPKRIGGHCGKDGCVDDQDYFFPYSFIATQKMGAVSGPQKDKSWVLAAAGRGHVVPWEAPGVEVLIPASQPCSFGQVTSPTWEANCGVLLESKTPRSHLPVEWSPVGISQ